MKKSVAETFGIDPKTLEPEEEYSASNFNQLCQDFDRLNETYLALKKACDEAEPVGRVITWKPLDGIVTVRQYHKTNGYPDPKIGSEVFTSPPNTAAIEQRVAEAIAKMLDMEGCNSAAIATRLDNWREYQ